MVEASEIDLNQIGKKIRQEGFEEGKRVGAKEAYGKVLAEMPKIIDLVVHDDSIDNENKMGKAWDILEKRLKSLEEKGLR